MPKSPKANYIFDTTPDVPMSGHTEVVERVTRRNLDVCCVQEGRRRSVSARLITRKNSEHKMYWVGNNLGLSGVGILIARKSIDNIFDVKFLNDRLIMIKLLIGKRTVAIVSTCAPKQGLAEDRKYKSSLVSNVGENELVILYGDVIGHLRKDGNGYDGIH